MDHKQLQSAELQEICNLRLQTASLMQALLEARQQLQRSEGEAKNAVERSRAADQRAAEAELESQLILTSLGNRDADVNELENRLEAVEADAADERERFAKVEADNYAYLQELKARAAEAEAHLNGIVGAVGWLETFVFEINMDGETDYERCIIDLLKKHEAAAAWLEAGEGKGLEDKE